MIKRYRIKYIRPVYIPLTTLLAYTERLSVGPADETSVSDDLPEHVPRQSSSCLLPTRVPYSRPRRIGNNRLQRVSTGK